MSLDPTLLRIAKVKGQICNGRNEVTTVDSTWSGLVEALSIWLDQAGHGSMQGHECNQR